MNSKETNNQVEYTQEEKDLAKKFDVEPKVVRLNPEYFSEHAEESRKAEAEEPETQEQPQGQESTPGENSKDVNQNTYTEEETSLAAKYQVEPKLVRLLNELIKEKLAPPEQPAFDQKQPRKFEGEPKQGMPRKFEVAEPEQEQPAELSIDQQTQERLKSYYKNLEPRTKLAILTLSEIQGLDGINFQIRKGEERLYEQIWDDMQSVCIETFHSESVPDTALGVIDSIAAIGEPDEDVWLAGIWEAVRMVIQNC